MNCTSAYCPTSNNFICCFKQANNHVCCEKGDLCCIQQAFPSVPTEISDSAFLRYEITPMELGLPAPSISAMDNWNEAGKLIKLMRTNFSHVHEQRKNIALGENEEVLDLLTPLIDECSYEKSEAINCKIFLTAGDIVMLPSDVIVVNASSTLTPCPGIYGLVHYFGGKELTEECSSIGTCSIGEVQITKSYQLPSKFVYHTLPPPATAPEKLEVCYKNSLQKAAQCNEVRTIAFSCLGTSEHGGFHPVKAAHAALKQTREFLEDPQNRNSLEKIIFVVKNACNQEIYEHLMLHYFPV